MKKGFSATNQAIMAFQAACKPPPAPKKKSQLVKLLDSAVNDCQ
jgi:hypothetical protein